MQHAETIERLYREHHYPVQKALRRKFTTSALMQDCVEDAMSDAWLILARKLDTDRDYIDEPRFALWLYVVARNELLRHGRIRSQHVSPFDPDQALSEHPAYWSAEREALADLELRDLVDQLTGAERDYEVRTDPNGCPRLYARLTRARRQALMTRLIGLSYQQATEATGKTYTAVNRGIREGREALQ